MSLVTDAQAEDPQRSIPWSLRRQEWLEAAVEALRDRFAIAGYDVPQQVRVTIGWPKKAAVCGRVGECWSTEASSDRYAEMFISPELTRGPYIVEVLAHELIHATVGTDAGHGPLFKRCALAIGLRGPMRSTSAGPELTAWIDAVIARIGIYPAGFIIDEKKQSTRQQRCQCPTCGYLARVTRKWLESAGAPICPTDKVVMMVTR
jgi:hypothetical protein